MRLPRSSTEAVLSAIFLPSLAIASGSYDCDNIVVNGHQWHLKELGGPKSALQSEPLASGTGFTNTTYTIDICKPLKKESKEVKCPNYTRVCAVQRDVSSDGSADLLTDSWPLAGDLKDFGGKNLDSKWESLSESNSHADSEKEGLRLSMNGGTHKVHDQDRPQKVIVEFLCDKNRTGNEYLWAPEDKYNNERRAEGEDSKKPDENKEPSLKFLSYDTSKADADTDILRLEWRTKFACLDAIKEEPKANDSWGFFTWFILIAFLSTATYLIFGSWLNYNRYGARGWDLLPHGDTIRDAPYLLKDWIRRVMSTIQGGGSRGGYAAV